MSVPPCGDATVGAVQVAVRPLEVGKRAEPEAAHDRQEQRQRQRESRGGARVEPVYERAPKPRVRGCGLAYLAGRCEGGS